MSLGSVRPEHPPLLVADHASAPLEVADQASALKRIALDVDLQDSASQRAACALISVIDGAFAAVSSRNATARPKISPMVWPAS